MYYKRIGFTIGAIFIILVSAALVVAIGRAREQANIAQCANSLKQLGLGLILYADHNRQFFPAGTIVNDSLPPSRRWSWYLELMPYMVDSGGREELLDRSAAWDAPNRYPGSSPFINQFLLCPSNDRHDAMTDTHYVGAAGLGPDAPELDRAHPRAGIFGYNRSASWHDILGDIDEDRTPGETQKRESSVMVLFETAMDNGPWVAGGRPTVRGIEKNLPLFGPTGQCGSFHVTRDSFFGGPISVSNFAMADGSIRLLTEKTDPAIVEELAILSAKRNSADRKK